MKNPYSLANFSKEDFMNLFSELYEHSPWVIEKAYISVKYNEKYDNINEFHSLLSQIILSADKESQLKLIKAHPMLAGSETKEGELTEFSTNEQKSAGLNSCTKKEIQLFNSLNETYFTKFGFPYILAVKGKSKQEVIEDFSKRIEYEYEDERVKALQQINKIALIRIKDIYES